MMNNPIFSAMMQNTPFGNVQNLMQQYQQFRSQFRGDPPQGIEEYGDSDFLQAIVGRDTAEIMAVMDELMETILITNPRLYQGVMRKIKGQI